MKIKLLLISALVLLFAPLAVVHAASTDNLAGYAWSSNVGWVSLNCTNDATCATNNYGVTMAPNGTITGYAWSPNVGWISFNSADTSSCPTGTGCQASYASSTGQVTGWARAVTGEDTNVNDTGSWAGWISLSGTNYSTSISNCNWGGYAWGGGPDSGSGVIGWLSFSGTTGDGHAYGVTGGNGCVQALPDLTAALIPSQANITIPTNQSLTLSATVSNIGSGGTNVPFATTFWTNTAQNMLGSNVQYTEFSSGVPGGFPANYSETDGPQLPVTRSFATAGTYYYQVCADLDNNWSRSVTESNNNNDCTAWGTITVTPPTISCTPSTNTGVIGQKITWTPVSSGFGGTPTYTWTGVGGYGTPVSGSGSTFVNSYSSAGSFATHVVATKGATSASADCSAVAISPATVGITATPARVQQGTGGVIVKWTSTNATTCTVTGNGNSWSGLSGTQTDPNPINAQATYTANCATSGNAISSSTVVNIAPKFTNF